MSDHLTDEQINGLQVWDFCGFLSGVFHQARKANYLCACLQNTVTLILRLCRCLPRDHQVRSQALNYLSRQNLMPSPLCDESAHLQVGSNDDVYNTEKIESATIAKVVAWAKSQVARDTQFAESAHKRGEPTFSRYHFARVEMLADLIRQLESGEWAKDEA